MIIASVGTFIRGYSYEYPHCAGRSDARPQRFSSFVYPTFIGNPSGGPTFKTMACCGPSSRFLRPMWHDAICSSPSMSNCRLVLSICGAAASTLCPMHLHRPNCRPIRRHCRYRFAPQLAVFLSCTGSDKQDKSGHTAYNLIPWLSLTTEHHFGET